MAFSSSGRPSGTNWFADYQSEDVQPRLPHNPSDILKKLEELQSELKTKNEIIFEQQKRIEEKDRALEEMQENEPEIQRKIARSGPPLKSWTDLSGKQKGRTTEDLQELVLSKAKERDIDPVQLSGYMVHR